MTITLSYDEAIQLLERAVEEKGADYVYNRKESSGNPRSVNGACWYFDPDGQPGCIIGHVLAYKGATAESLGKYNVSASVRTLVNAKILSADSDTFVLLYTAQKMQDSGQRWGAALAHGKLASERS